MGAYRQMPLGRLGFWKAEELQKISYPAAEWVLAELVSDDEYQIGQLLSRIMELIFFNRS